jgi:pimeloyl-ACP methyl ester carboxylesterase
MSNSLIWVFVTLRLSQHCILHFDLGFLGVVSLQEYIYIREIRRLKSLEVNKEKMTASSSLRVGNVNTSLYKEGAGQAITMIHGATYNHRLWIRQIHVLSSIGEVYALDLPGHGGSSEFSASQIVSIKSYADHVHKLLTAIGCSSTVLVGHSMGGAVSIRYTLDHPSLVKALILVGTGAKLGVIPMIFEALSANYEQGIRLGVAAWAFAKTTDKSVIEEGINEMLKCPQDIATADFKACSEFDLRDSISRIEAPTLIIVGDEDKLTPVKWSEYLHNKIRNSEMKIVKGAGHMVIVEKPDEVNESMMSFLNKTISRRKPN